MTAPRQERTALAAVVIKFTIQMEGRELGQMILGRNARGTGAKKRQQSESENRFARFPKQLHETPTSFPAWEESQPAQWRTREGNWLVEGSLDEQRAARNSRPIPFGGW